MQKQQIGIDSIDQFSYENIGKKYATKFNDIKYFASNALQRD